MNLVRHFVAEEQYLYPEVQDALDHGDEIAEEHLTADRAIEAKLRKLEDPDLTAELLQLSGLNFAPGSPHTLSDRTRSLLLWSPLARRSDSPISATRCWVQSNL